MTPSSPRAFLGLQLTCAVLLTAFVVHTLVDLPSRVAWVFNYPVYYGLEVIAAAALWVRALVARDRRAGWAAMAAAVTMYVVGELVYLGLYSHDPAPPYPSIADGLYLSFYPLSYLALALLFRSRFRGITPALWMDGVLAALAATALGSAFVVESVLDTDGGSGPFATVVTNLSYPFGDVILLSLVLAAFALANGRPGRGWIFLGASLLVFAAGDSVYLDMTWRGTYVEGGLVDATWPTGLLLIAFAAWRDPANRRTIDIAGRPLLPIPAVCGGAAAALLVYDHFARINIVAVIASLATFVAMLGRLGLAFRENRQLLLRTRSDAVTDPLTGLGNRRQLFADLEACLQDASDGHPRLLAIYDLDGFKGYNDTFGHPAGDMLLARLGAKLAQVVGDDGGVYRLGGDEFCLLSPADGDQAEAIIDRSLEALVEHGEGFSVSSSFGAVIIPDEVDDPVQALRVADERLYQQKHARRTLPDRPQDALMAALLERAPGLHGHLEGVAELALALGHSYGMTGSQLERLHRAALLHDVGKIAVPDEILSKPGPLTEEEWRFVRQHTIVGERILAASPALREVGRIIRSTHEQFDGTGYPDGLCGDEIALEARIVHACDALDAMTRDRPYKDRQSLESALAELERCAGTQFDPDVVRRLLSHARERERLVA
jgi:diguanylate cyclase (GGDEF)-like protein